MHPIKGIVLRILAYALFSMMSALVRLLGAAVPLGEIVFFRNLAAVATIVIVYAIRRELATALRFNRPLLHLSRGGVSAFGMYASFGSFVYLPLADATGISFAGPLLTVVLAAIFLKEKVRPYRWGAIAVGFIGVLVMLLPHFDLDGRAASETATMGVLFALGSVITSGINQTQTRTMTRTETTPSIVLSFSFVTMVAGAATLPFSWQAPTPTQLALLAATGVCGSVGHLIMTETFRLAPASVLAPFDYTAMIWAVILGYAMFGEMPTLAIYAGSVIVVASGLLVIWRERALAREAERSGDNPPPQS